MGKQCSVEGCTNKVFSNGLCSYHAPKKPLKKTPLKQPLKKKIPNKKPQPPKGKKAHKQKRRSVKQLKTALDRVFSVFIRMRDADNEGYVSCFTSGCRIWWLRAQNGHFMSRRYNATRWHEQNCAAQSVASNMFLAGEQYIFGKNLDLRWGAGTADEMVRLSKTDFKLTIDWLEEKILYYQKQVQKLKSEKGL